MGFCCLRENAREIDIGILCWGKAGLLPGDLFTRGTLLVLKLSFSVHEVPSFSLSTNLKVVHLEGIEFKDDASIGTLLSSCPVLED